jgi:hypothetical protein
VSLLALATLGNSTQIGSFLFFVALPKVAKARSYMVIAAAVPGVIALNFCQCKPGFTLQIEKRIMIISFVQTRPGL